MDGDPALERTARLDEGIGTVDDPPAATLAEDRRADGPDEPGRAEGGDPERLCATLAGESIGPRPDATVVFDLE